MTSKEEAIRQRAYAIWEEEGRPHGQHAEHWQRAEGELNGGARAKRGRTAVAKSAAALTGAPGGAKKASAKANGPIPAKAAPVKPQAAGRKPEKPDMAKAAPVRARMAKLSEPEGIALAKDSLASRDA